MTSLLDALAVIRAATIMFTHSPLATSARPEARADRTYGLFELELPGMLKEI